MSDWTELKVGDRIRMVAIPEHDQRQFDADGDDFKVSVLRHLIDAHAIVTIARIDEYGHPWIDLEILNAVGDSEHHSINVIDNESWVRE